MFIVLAPRFVSYWGCPGADPENPETVSGAIRAGKLAQCAHSSLIGVSIFRYMFNKAD